MTAAVLGSAIGSIVGGTLQVGASTGSAAGTAVTAAAGATAAKAGPGDMGAGYFLDSLFRRAPEAAAPLAAASTPSDGSALVTATTAPVAASNPAQRIAEIGRIFLNSIGTGALPPADARYAAQLVSQATGLSPQEAEKRVTDTYAQMQTKLRDAEAAARDAADKARKAAAYTALWLFISLLIGAFTASLAATYGGRRRDL